MNDIILASASPRRAELLSQIGISYQVQAVNIDESRLPHETPEALGGFDTLDVLDGELLLKPRNYQHALLMLSKMSGHWHEILTAVAITHAGKTKLVLNRNYVLFYQITTEEILAYWKTGEPQDKAGAYAIQGLGASFIKPESVRSMRITGRKILV